MKKVIVILAASACLFGGTAKAKTIAVRDCPGHVIGVYYYRHQVWMIQDRMGVGHYPSTFNPKRQGCEYTQWVARVWRHRFYKEKAKLTDWKTLDADGWVSATAEADKVFPGTRQWLLDCSGGTAPGTGEGGWGRWVSNSEGSGAGGWMQFLSDTYYSYSYDAFDEARARGFNISERHNSWYDPIGQALTAAYMRNLGISHNHWEPSIDSACE